MSFSAVGQVFDARAFEKHVSTLDLSWANAVCLHHTAYPDLSMRPKGWTIQHMRNLASYYGGELGWSAGPHLFTDEDEIFGLSPLTTRGVHAKSFNARSIGIEALGNYDHEKPASGRGLEVWRTTAAATAILLRRMGLPATGQTVLFHRDDPKTTKTCPGRLVAKEWVLSLVNEEMVRLAHRDAQADRAANDKESSAPPEPDDLDTSTSNVAKARRHLQEALALLG